MIENTMTIKRIIEISIRMILFKLTVRLRVNSHWFLGDSSEINSETGHPQWGHLSALSLTSCPHSLHLIKAILITPESRDRESMQSFRARY